MNPTLLTLSFPAVLLVVLVSLFNPPSASWADTQTNPPVPLMPALSELSPTFPNTGNDVMQAIPLQPNVPFAAEQPTPPIPARLMAEALSPQAAMQRWTQDPPLAPLPFETQLVRIDFKEAELPPASVQPQGLLAPVPMADTTTELAPTQPIASSSQIADSPAATTARRTLGQRLFGWLQRNRSTSPPPSSSSSAPAPTYSAIPPAATPQPQAASSGWFHHGNHAPTSASPQPAVPALDMQTVGVSSSTNRASANTQWVELQVLTANPLPLSSLARTVKTYNKVWSDEYVQQMAKLLLDLSAQQSVDYKLLASIIAVESSFRVNAVSPTGAMGLGQLLPATARWLQVSNPFDPVDNAMAVSRYLRYLQNAFPNEQDKAIASYFVGQGTVKRSGISPSAQAYVNKVATVVKQLEQQ